MAGIRVRITIANLCTVNDTPECQHIMIHDVSNKSIRYPRLLIQYLGLFCLDNISQEISVSGFSHNYGRGVTRLYCTSITQPLTDKLHGVSRCLAQVFYCLFLRPEKRSVIILGHALSRYMVQRHGPGHLRCVESAERSVSHQSRIHF